MMLLSPPIPLLPLTLMSHHQRMSLTFESLCVLLQKGHMEQTAVTPTTHFKLTFTKKSFSPSAITILNTLKQTLHFFNIPFNQLLFLTVPLSYQSCVF